MMKSLNAVAAGSSRLRRRCTTYQLWISGRPATSTTAIRPSLARAQRMGRQEAQPHSGHHCLLDRLVAARSPSRREAWAASDRMPGPSRCACRILPRERETARGDQRRQRHALAEAPADAPGCATTTYGGARTASPPVRGAPADVTMMPRSVRLSADLLQQLRAIHNSSWNADPGGLRVERRQQSWGKK